MRCPLLWGYPKLSSMENFRMFPYKPSTLGYPIVGNPYNGRVAALQDNLPNLLRNIIHHSSCPAKGIFMHFPHKVSASAPQCFFGDFTAKLPEISEKNLPKSPISPMFGWTLRRPSLPRSPISHRWPRRAPGRAWRRAPAPRVCSSGLGISSWRIYDGLFTFINQH